MIERIVLFGASGDLTARLLMPAFAQLAEGGYLPQKFSILGSAVEDWSPEEFRNRMSNALEAHAPNISRLAKDKIVGMLDYRTADVTDASDVTGIIGDEHQPTLIYLALPTGLIERSLQAMSQANLNEHDAVAIEKPFGTDLASAKQLNHALRTLVPLPTIFRIDHFLSDELVRRILALRFGNRVFEPLLSAQHVERIDICWLESLALEGRAGYYDRAGALRDMIQNHLLEALSLIIMEQPARMDEPSFRGNRVEALRGIATPTLESIREGTTRARYTAGSIGGRPIPAYVDEPGVDGSRNTETYAAVQLQIPNSRWDGTRFTLRSGKAMSQSSAEISIHFKRVRGWHRDVPHEIAPNVLRIGLMEPYISLQTNINGPNFAPVVETMNAVSEKPIHTAYANLMIEMLNNRPMLLIRDDEAEELWRITDPILKAWQDNEVPLQDYAAGSAPPE